MNFPHGRTFCFIIDGGLIFSFSFYEFENDERIIETSFKINITNFHSQLFV